MIRESWLTWKHRAHRYAPVFDHDWAASPYTRASVVNLLLRDRPDKRYLEIGCAGDELFAAVASEAKIGVDPARGGTHRMTSDVFFETHPDARFDVIFIDGLHLYDQVRRDVVNALAALAPGGWIAIHDMLPRDWIEEHVPQISTAGWTGDGWKVAFELAETRGLDFRLLTIDHGVVIVRPGLEAVCLADCRAALRDLRFDYLHRNFDRLPVLDFGAGRAWIDAQRVGRAG